MESLRPNVLKALNGKGNSGWAAISLVLFVFFFSVITKLGVLCHLRFFVVSTDSEVFCFRFACVFDCK